MELGSYNNLAQREKCNSFRILHNHSTLFQVEVKPAQLPWEAATVLQYRLGQHRQSRRVNLCIPNGYKCQVLCCTMYVHLDPFGTSESAYLCSILNKHLQMQPWLFLKTVPSVSSSKRGFFKFFCYYCTVQ